jgi:hypothetical protein
MISLTQPTSSSVRFSTYTPFLISSRSCTLGFMLGKITENGVALICRIHFNNSVKAYCKICGRRVKKICNLFIVNLKKRTLAVVLELFVPPALFLLQFWVAHITGSRLAA